MQYMTSVKGKSSRQNKSYQEHMAIEKVLLDDSVGFLFLPINSLYGILKGVSDKCNKLLTMTKKNL